MLGASIDGVICNVALNEGGLALRVSSDATILDEDGKERTSKSISPIQTESDHVAYGSREDKIQNAIVQKRGWDTNARLQAPLYTAIEPPRSAEMRSRGEFGFSKAYTDEAHERRMESQVLPNSFIRADGLMLRASNPKVAQCVNSAL
eukprot:6260395-Prymnesium_polylepis.1